ncbi:hypothetical protein C8R41DRAFT_925076 [Lentinula lateritia]|uniref:Uncharacterized protein n=1 Tax=Lentinula lateritia TaxID=40482 RepID=A0ABQ8V1M4_9AGAR|nr:hypothetical protein C8R41DRAFT_925076 [Lentinula lateritia]
MKRSNRNTPGSSPGYRPASSSPYQPSSSSHATRNGRHQWYKLHSVRAREEADSGSPTPRSSGIRGQHKRKELSWAEDSQIQTYTYVDHMREFNARWNTATKSSKIIVSDNDSDSVTSGIESTTRHKFDRLANGDSQDPRTYRYDPGRYGSESYDLLDKGFREDLTASPKMENSLLLYPASPVPKNKQSAYTADSPVLKIENPVVNSAQEKQAYNATALLAINVELKRRLKDSEDELASVKAHVDELENKLHLWKEIFNRMGVISTSVADGSFEADKVLDSLNRHLISKYRETQ